MKSRPVLEFFLVLALFAAAGLPLSRALRTDGGARTAALSAPSLRAEAHEPEEKGPLRVFARIRFAHAPSKAALETADGRVVWSVSGSSADGGLSWETEFDAMPSADGRLPLVIKAEWPDGTPESAVEIRIEPDGLPTESQTAWGRGGLSRKLLFSARAGGAQ